MLRKTLMRTLASLLAILLLSSTSLATDLQEDSFTPYKLLLGGKAVSVASVEKNKPQQTESPEPQDAVPVSGTVENSGKAITENSNIVQDMYSYMQKKMDFDAIETKNDGTQYRRFTGDSSTYRLVDEYVEMICSEEYNLELVDCYYKSYGSDSYFFSFTMDYTDTAKLRGEKSEMNYVDGMYGDVTIWGSLNGSRCEGYIHITKGLDFGDLGLRIGGEQESTDLSGESLGTGLYRMSDGSYQTADGRFSVKSGEAMIYRDGERCTAEAELTRNSEKGREEIRIYNFYRNDSILLSLPYSSVLTGDVLNRSAIGVNEDGSNGGYEEFIDSMEDFLAWTFSDKILGVRHDGDYLLCYCDDYNDFEDAVVQVMYWDAAEGEAVFYIYAEFDSAPYEYEAIAAVRMQNAERKESSSSSTSSSSYSSSSSSSSSYSSSSSKHTATCTKCHGSGSVSCSNCSGKGYKEKYISTPNFSGSTSFKSSSTVRENCFKCHGSGKTSCSRCGGSGKTTY